MAIITPTITMPTIPTPPPVPSLIAPTVFAAYGTLVQDYLDGRIQDFAAYYTPIVVIRAELNMLRDQLFRKYHRSRKEMLQTEGKKNLSIIPGYLQRKLMDLSLDEKRELTEQGMKITAKHAEESLAAVYEGADLAIKSDAIRSDMHIKIQAMDFEVAKAALMAGYEYSKQNITQFESQIKAIKTEFELVTIEYKALADAVEAEISAVKIQIVAAENIGVAEELQKVAAELEVARTQILEAQSQIPLIQTEIDKALAQMDILRAEQALATFRELAANASMEKSLARENEIEISRQKIALDLEKVALQIEKDAADTASELSTIAARSVEEALENTKATRRIFQVYTDTTLTDAKGTIADADTTAAGETATYLVGRSAEVADRVTGRASERKSDLDSRGDIESMTIGTRAVDKVAHIGSRVTERSADLATRANDTKDRLYAEANNRVSDLNTRANDRVNDFSLRTADEVARLDVKEADRVNEWTQRGIDTDALIQEMANNKITALVIEANDIAKYANEKIAMLEAKIRGINTEMADWYNLYRDALSREAEGVLGAAANAANAHVDTTYVYVRGTGTPTAPSDVSTPSTASPNISVPPVAES